MPLRPMAETILGDMRHGRLESGVGRVSDSDRDVLDEFLHVAEAIHAAARLRKGRPDLSDKTLDNLYLLRMGSSRQGSHDTALHVSLEIVNREVEAARRDPGVKAYDRAIIALADLLRERARLSSPTRRTAAAMTRELCDALRATPKRYESYLRDAHRAPRPDEILILTGAEAGDWRVFVAGMAEEARRRGEPPADRVARTTPQSVDLNVAKRLSQVAAREEEADDDWLPVYDASDRNIRIMDVRVTGFRGSAGTGTLDLTKGGRAADVLLWGDNGEGKSSLIDGMEFALQRRVDRSADFNSTLRASVRNLSSPIAHAAVLLSDGSLVERSLVRNKAGRDEPSDGEVRPGFRIAPLVIRRADILRFLDTDALTRGTVFFDYFPHPSQALGERPDEELKMMEEERFLLRVARDDLSEQLAGRYPEAKTDFADSGQLNRFVENLLAEVNVEELEDPLDAIPEEVRRVIGELRAVQSRIKLIKGKVDKGVQSLNPVAYKSQLSRVVPILRSVGEDLTASFKRIARANHVTAIKVLVAKTGPVSLDVVVDFDNGASALPQQVFSEGYKDLIALLFFLAVIRKAAEFGQARILVLDDALQSVDATVRLGVMAYVLEEFKDWQLIITGHDRAWQEQLRELFIRKSRVFVERRVADWSFYDGIAVAGGSPSLADSARSALADRDERLTASATGTLLEQIAQELSWRAGISVTRRKGDRYTLGDLWPGVAKALRATSLRDTVNAIDEKYGLRNSLGAHYNNWADGIPWSDIRNFAEDVLKLYDAVYCTTCANWTEKKGKELRCRCGTITLH
jgi:recombinational DNA repair ATPase RecF